MIGSPPLLASGLCLVLFPLASAADEHWPSWRGPLGTGVAPASNPPIEWSEEHNVRWKVAIPGKGHASPVIWDDVIYLLSAVPVGEPVQQPDPPAGEDGQRRRNRLAPAQTQQFIVMALDRADGSILWEEVATELVPHEGTHSDGTWASASAVTDGEHLLAFFGSRGLFAYDLEGTLLWEKQFGEMTTRNGFGEGSSPALHGDTVVVQWDHEGESFIVALDKRTGEERWRRERDEPTSWATPVVIEVDGKPQVIANGTNRIRGYDLATGETVWECGGMTLNAVPTPVHEDGTLYVMSGFRGNALLAIRLAGAKGDITGSEAVLWEYDRDTPYVPSPVLYGGALYFLKSNNGILSAFDVRTGKQQFGPERLETIANIYASPVAAAGRIYLVGREGSCEVLEHGSGYKLLAKNTLDDGFDASPAVVGDELYLRGRQHLYCIAEP